MTTLRELLITATTPEPKNSQEFAQKQAEKHNAHILGLSEKVYQAYISQGEEVALKRKNVYLERNWAHWTQFV